MYCRSRKVSSRANKKKENDQLTSVLAQHSSLAFSHPAKALVTSPSYCLTCINLVCLIAHHAAHHVAHHVTHCKVPAFLPNSL